MSYLVYHIVECNYVGMCKNLKKRKQSHTRLQNFKDINYEKYNRKLYTYIRTNNLNPKELSYKILQDNIYDKKRRNKLKVFLCFYIIQLKTEQMPDIVIIQIHNKNGLRKI